VLQQTSDNATFKIQKYLGKDAEKLHLTYNEQDLDLKTKVDKVMPIDNDIQDTIPKTQFTNIDGVIEKEESIQIATNDKLVYKYCTIEDSGIEIDRVINNTIVWRIFVKPLNVSHSKYKHQAKIKIRDKSIFISSVGSYGRFYEERNLQTGKLIHRKEDNN
jgi:hypothetical protein